MTNQQAFDIVAEGLLRQNAKSMCVTGTECMYRGFNGRKCAAGFLIPDEKYERSLEYQSVDNREVLDVLPGGLNVGLIKALQFTHDCYMVSEWPRQLRLIAERHHLNPEVLDKCAASKVDDVAVTHARDLNVNARFKDSDGIEYVVVYRSDEGRIHAVDVDTLAVAVFQPLESVFV